MKTVHTRYTLLKILVVILILSLSVSTYADVSGDDGYGSTENEYKGPYNLTVEHEVNLYYDKPEEIKKLKETIYQEFLTWGMTPQGAAAALGNILCESGADPTRLENDVSWEGWVYGSTGTGLIQWTFWSLQADLLNTAATKGKSWTSLDVQFEAMKHIFGPDSSISYLYEKGAGTAYDLAGRFLVDVENPEIKDYVERGNSAIAAFNELSGLAPEEYSGDYDVSSSVGDIISGNADFSVLSEWELEGMPQASGLSSQLLQVRLPDALQDYAENLNVHQIGENISSRHEMDGWRAARSVMVFSGLALIMYSIFLLLALIFDNVNNFIDIQLIHLLTLGALYYTKDPEALVKHRRYASMKRMIVVIITFFVVGSLLVSGGVFSFVMRMVYKIVGNRGYFI